MKNLKQNISKGIAAGFIATVVLTMFMMIKTKMGVMPELNPIMTLTNLSAEAFGITPNIALGWFLHFGLGSITWGVAFALFNTIIPGNAQLTKGIFFGGLAWLAMMFGLMPISGQGIMGLNGGVMVPVMTLVLHVIFGSALGLAYKKLNQKKAVKDEISNTTIIGAK